MSRNLLYNFRYNDHTLIEEIYFCLIQVFLCFYQENLEPNQEFDEFDEGPDVQYLYSIPGDIDDDVSYMYTVNS